MCFKCHAIYNCDFLTAVYVHGASGSHCRLVSTSCVSGASIAIGSGKELDMSSTYERSGVLLSLCCFWCTFLGIVAQEDEGEWFGLSM